MLKLVLVSTNGVKEEVRPHLEEFLAGRTSYVSVLNQTGWDSRQLDTLLAEMVCHSVALNTPQNSLTH